MMVSSLFALLLVPIGDQSAAIPMASGPSVLATLPPQTLPARGCAAYLWTIEDQRLVAMAEPGRLRLALDGKPTDLAAQQAEGAGALGFSGSTRYAGGGGAVTLDMTIVPRESLKDGAIVTQASLRIMRAGGDEIAVPVGGLIGCAPQTP